MKKLILAAIAVGSLTAANAQKAGSLLIYGDLGVSSHTSTFDDGIVRTPDTKVKDFGVHFMPGVGFQINNKLTVGLNFGVGFNKSSTDPATVVEKERMLGVGPFVRLTQPLSHTFFVFNQLNLSYLNGKKTTDNPTPIFDPIYTSNGFVANILPGVGVNFSKSLALNFGFGGLQYGFSKETNNVDAKVNKHSGFDFTLGRQFSLGISANIGGKKSKGCCGEPGSEFRRHHDSSDDDADIKVKRKKVTVDDEE